MANLVWSEECDKVYGVVGEFKDKKEFIKAVKETALKDFGWKNCEISNIQVEPCIDTEKGLHGEYLIPLRLTDVIIMNYYTAVIVKVE